MFTGLVEALSPVHSVAAEGAGRRLLVTAPSMASDMELGESVAINGACLTVVQVEPERLHFQAGPETLLRTNLGELGAGDRVNLERSLRVGDRLGGHWVQGHVDGIGHVVERAGQGGWELFWFRCPEELAAQMVPKGSIAVDGISLTLVDVTADRFSVALIPHTLACTTLGFKQPGATVNLETDILAKYVWKCLGHGGVSWETLQRAGFLARSSS